MFHQQIGLIGFTKLNLWEDVAKVEEPPVNHIPESHAAEAASVEAWF